MAARNDSTVKSLGDGSVLNEDSSGSFTVVSFNLHGFNQGSHAMIDTNKYDIFLVQEHRLTPVRYQPAFLKMLLFVFQPQKIVFPKGL